MGSTTNSPEISPPHVPNPPLSLAERQSAITFMVTTFKLERIAYLIITLLSFTGLATCMYFFVQASLHKVGGLTTVDLGYVAGMFGTGGVIGMAAARLLKMWTDCLLIIRGLQS